MRRELLRARLDLSVARLNRIIAEVRVEPVTAEIWLAAARLWAESRKRGRPTADPKELDIDVLLAATAISLQSEDEVVIATNNVANSPNSSKPATGGTSPSTRLTTPATSPGRRG